MSESNCGLVTFSDVEPLRLYRYPDGFGKLYYRGIFLCDTGENNDLKIPPGEYHLGWTYSPKFKAFRYEVLDVPGRSRILIHEGNYPLKDSKGCILVGVRAQNVLQYSVITLQRINLNIRSIEIPYINIREVYYGVK